MNGPSRCMYVVSIPVFSAYTRSHQFPPSPYRFIIKSVRRNIDGAWAIFVSMYDFFMLDYWDFWRILGSVVCFELFPGGYWMCLVGT